MNTPRGIAAAPCAPRRRFFALALCATLLPGAAGAYGLSASSPTAAEAERPTPVAELTAEDLLAPPEALTATLAAPGVEDLAEIYRLAVASDPTLRAAAANRDAERTLIPQAEAALLPTLSASANASGHRRSGGAGGETDYDAHSYGLALTQPLYNRVARGGLEQAQALVAGAEADYLDARQGLILRVAERYFALLAAQDDVTLAAAERRAIAQQLESAQQRFEAGVGDIADAQEAQARFDLASAQEILAGNALEVGRERLREITGQRTERIAPLRADLPLLPPDPDRVEAWIEIAAAQSPRLVAQQRRMDVARADIAVQRAARYPAVNLTLAGERADGGTGSGVATDYRIGVSAALSLYQGGAIDARIGAAHHRLTAAQEGLEQTRRALERGVRTAFATVEGDIKRVQALRQARESHQIALEATQAGFEAGTRTALDVLNARRELFRAHRDHVAARYDYLLGLLRLKETAGALRADDLGTINDLLTRD